ncbi:hypothetical protein DA075_04425 [Methylobacterium currus]|uniref:DUF1795 domain-containing protein n=1 Tax=Methylobacterium currus TaxID=2051553 RepID=A0A2R4WFF2_9HYPH|nr:hypothetical protein DA075_04425 [Methylobacterium currus]
MRSRPGRSTFRRAPIVGIDVPAAWKTSPTSRGVEVKSPDEEVFFWLETYRPADEAAVRKEHNGYFAGQGVTMAGDPQISRFEEGSLKVQATDLPATWQGKPTVLRYLAIDAGLPDGRMVLLSYWASPEGDRRHAAAFKAIVNSLGSPK